MYHTIIFRLSFEPCQRECCRAQRIFQYNACGGKHTTKNGGPEGRVWDDGRTDFRKRPDRTAAFIRTTVHTHRLPVFHVILSKPEAQSKDPYFLRCIASRSHWPQGKRVLRHAAMRRLRTTSVARRCGRGNRCGGGTRHHPTNVDGSADESRPPLTRGLAKLALRNQF